MRHPRLFMLLASLSKEEFKRFGKFVASPYFTESDGVRDFYKYLKKHHPVFDEKKMQLEANFERDFAERLELRQPLEGEAAASKRRQMLDEKLNHLLSDTYRLLETFLVVEEVLGDPAPQAGDPAGTAPQLQARLSSIPLRDELLVKALGRHGPYGLYLKLSQSLMGKLEGLPVRNSEDYWLLSQLCHWLYYHPGTNKLQRRVPSIGDAMQHLDLSFLLSKLRYIAECHGRQEVSPLEGRIAFSDEVVSEASLVVLSDKDGQHKLIAIYLELVKLYQSPGSEQRFASAEELFMRHAPMLPFVENRALFAHFSNFGSRLYSFENPAAGPTLLSLYQRAMQQGLLVANQRMTESAFLNISHLLAVFSDFDSTMRFIQAWKVFLEEGKSSNAVAAALAELWFAKGDFDRAHERLTEITANCAPYVFLTKGLLLKIFFERFIKDRSQHKPFGDHAAAFERLINSQPTGHARHEAWLNFVRFARSLAGFWLKNGRFSPSNKPRFTAELAAMRYVFSRSWLLQKIEAF